MSEDGQTSKKGVVSNTIAQEKIAFILGLGFNTFLVISLAIRPVGY
jgi:hypothetical protein